MKKIKSILNCILIATGISTTAFSANISDLGTITQIKVHGTMLYVAGQKGVAEMTSASDIKWLTILPDVDMRFVEIDDSAIAYTGYNFVGVDRQKNILIWGSGAQVIVCNNCIVGLLAADGSKKWEKPVDSQTRLAPPAIGATVLAVNSSSNLYVINRTDGTQIAKLDNQDVFGKKATQGLNSQFLPNQPLIYNGDIYSCGYYRLEQCDLAGNELVKSRYFSLSKPFESLTTAPFVFQDLIVFGNTSNTGGQVPNKVFCAKPDLKDAKWTDVIDKTSGVGSIAVGDGYFVAATNFMMKAYNAKGKTLWSFKLGLPAMRGVRFQGNDGSRKCEGNFLCIDNNVVYILNWKKGKKGQPDPAFVSEVDAKTGKLIKDVSTTTDDEVMDMQLLNGKIILLTANGLVTLDA